MTVGSEAVKLLQKGDQRQGVIDTQREMQKGYVDELIKCAKRYDWTDPFYICVQTRRERLLPNVVRCQFYGRQTRPRPEYDLALYTYDPKAEQLRFEWIVPDKETVEEVVTNHKKGFSQEIDVDLKRFCLAFHSHSLV
jgi:hypothetical protein